LRQIGVAVYSGCTGWLEACVDEFVDSLRGAADRIVVLLGGYRGGMRLVADRCIKAGIRTVMVIPSIYEDMGFPEESIVIRTGMGVRGRSVVLARSSDVMVALGGGAGTLMEIVTAYSLNRPVIIVRGSGLPTDKLASAYPDGVVDDRIEARMIYVDDCRSAGLEALRLLGLV